MRLSVTEVLLAGRELKAQMSWGQPIEKGAVWALVGSYLGKDYIFNRSEATLILDLSQIPAGLYSLEFGLEQDTRRVTVRWPERIIVV